jgi:hypothetical protein
MIKNSADYDYAEYLKIKHECILDTSILNPNGKWCGIKCDACGEHHLCYGTIKETLDKIEKIV